MTISDEDRKFINGCILNARQSISKYADDEGIDLAFFRFEITAVLVSCEDYKTPLHIMIDKDN